MKKSRPFIICMQIRLVDKSRRLLKKYIQKHTNFFISKIAFRTPENLVSDLQGSENPWLGTAVLAEQGFKLQNKNMGSHAV